MLDVTLVMVQPENQELGEELTDYVGFSWDNDPDLPGGGTLRYPANGNAAELLVPKARFAVLVDGVEPRRGRFVLEESSDDHLTAAGDPNRVVTWTFKGLLSLFEQVIIVPSGERARDVTFTALNAARLLWLNIIGDARARDPSTLYEISNPSFDVNEDSDGIAWQKTATITLSPGATAMDVLLWLRANNIAEYAMFESSLLLYNTGQHSLSDDWTEGPDQRFLQLGVDLIDSPKVVTAGTLVNAVYVVGDEERAVWRTDTASIAAYGRLEGTYQASGVSQPADLNRLGDMYLEANATPRQVRTYKVRTGNGKDPYTPTGYDLLDWMFVDDGTSPDGLPEVLRVMKVALTVDQGAASVQVAMNDWVQNHDIKMARLMSRVVSGMPGGGVPTRSAVPPAVPTGVDYTQALYAPPVGTGGGNRVRVDLTWDAVTTDIDGIAILDLSTYVIRWKYASKGWHEIIVGLELNGRIDGLDPGKELIVQVGARDDARNTSWTGDLT